MRTGKSGYQPHPNHTRRVIAPLALALLAGSAQATELIRDNFEANTVGSAPVSWTLNNSPATFTVATAAQSPIGGVGDNKGMRLDNDDSVTFESMNRTFTAQTGTFYLQFDYYGVAGMNNAHNLQIGNGGFGGNPNKTGINLTMSATSGVAEDTWYRFTLAMDVAADTYDLRVQTLETPFWDTTTTGVAFQNAQAQLDSLRFWFNTGNQTGAGDYYLDNILVTTNAADLNYTVIPEPSSTLSGLLLLLGLWKRQRR